MNWQLSQDFSTRPLIVDEEGNFVATVFTKGALNWRTNMAVLVSAPELLSALERIANSYPETDEGAWMAEEAREAITKANEPIVWAWDSPEPPK